MKSILCCLFILIFHFSAYSQDTIFMKNGNILPAWVQETDEVEIKYKKFNQPESESVYSVFIYDVSEIRFKNGRVQKYNRTDLYDINHSRYKSPIEEYAGMMWKFSFGVAENRFSRSPKDNLLTFWNWRNQTTGLSIQNNPRFMAFNFTMASALGASKRNWFGALFQIIGSPDNAISASYQNGLFLNELSLKTFHMNVSMFYGHSVNYKKNLIAVFEPSMEMGTMNGFINLDGKEYRVNAMSGFSSHFAVGMDWIISKRFLASVRGGKRFMKIEESHKDESSSTYYSRFYANRSINDDMLFVNWGGYYVSLGISVSFNTKMKSLRPE